MKYKPGLLILFMLMSKGVFAGGITGVVSSENQSVDNAELMLFSESDTVMIHMGYTNDKGEYAFKVEPGDYKLLTSKPDYSTVWVRYISVKDNNVVVNVELVPEAFKEGKKTTTEEECD